MVLNVFATKAVAIKVDANRNDGSGLVKERPRFVTVSAVFEVASDGRNHHPSDMPTFNANAKTERLRQSMIRLVITNASYSASHRSRAHAQLAQ